jgi:tetratricopeptide (TPR) repeat protein
MEVTAWVLENALSGNPKGKDPVSLLAAAAEKLAAVPRCETVVPLLSLLRTELSANDSLAALPGMLRTRGFCAHTENGPPLCRLHALCALLPTESREERAKTLQTAIPIALENLEQTPAGVLELLAEAVGQNPSPDEPSVAGDTPERALVLWRELIRWNPRARQKDKAYLATGLHAAKRGDYPAASDAFARLLRECPGSGLLGRTRLERARILLEVNNPEDAEPDLHGVLSSSDSSAALKADALVLLGEKHLRVSAPQKAIACFQRVYILYPSCETAVATAYLRSGEVFEHLRDADSARRTYAELLSFARLQALPQYEAARKKLQTLSP